MEKERLEEFQAQAALQQRDRDAANMVYAPQIADQQQYQRAILVEQTDPRRTLEEIELRLKGYEKRSDGTLARRGDPLMNETGINRILFIMGSVINQNTILSHLETREISNIMEHLSCDIIDDLTLNWKQYEIADKIMLDYIVDSIVITSFMSMKRALEQNEKNWLGRVSLEMISPFGQLPEKTSGAAGVLQKLKLR